MKKIVLDKHEAEIEKELDRGEWVEIDHMAEEMKRYQKFARHTLNKNKKINIRITDWDYEKIKIRAAQEGLPYQTLISSILHKYLTGQIRTS